MKKIALALVLCGIATGTQGCAAVLLGYVVADHENTKARVASCRSNLAMTNQARAAKGEDAIPDMCS